MKSVGDLRERSTHKQKFLILLLSNLPAFSFMVEALCVLFNVYWPQSLEDNLLWYPL